MFGKGFGWGRGRGWGYGGRGWRGFRWYGGPQVEGYRYVGPCRCGWGPHAYYMDKEGRLIHAWDLFGAEDELEALKREKEAIEQRIKELESKNKEA